jgi:hypothetical protein
MQSPNISFRQSRLRLAYEKELYRSTKMKYLLLRRNLKVKAIWHAMVTYVYCSLIRYVYVLGFVDASKTKD